MQTAIVILIVVAAACYLLRRFYTSVQKDSGCACGCSCDGCGPARQVDCTDPDRHA